MQTRRLLTGAALLLLVGPLAAGEAKKFIVEIAAAKEIDFARDHFSIGIVDGWVSSKDGFFKALLSKRKKMVVGIEGEITLFDNEVVKQAIVHNNEDIGRRLDRPWGLNLMLQSRVPADVRSRLEFRIALHRDDRKKNVRGAFGLEDPKAVKGRTILLVDDVSTTGSTLGQCARALKRAGAGEVFCLTLARAAHT